MRPLLLCLVALGLCLLLIQSVSASPGGKTADNAHLEPVTSDNIDASVPDLDGYQDKPAKAAYQGKASDCLARLTPAERANAMIRIELPARASMSAKSLAAGVTELWDKGQYENALAAFDKVAEKVDRSGLVVVCNWRTPVPSPEVPTDGRDFVSDIPIGSRTYITAIDFDIHRSTNTLMSVIKTMEDNPVTRLSICVSHDAGLSWSETGWLGLIFDEAQRTKATFLDNWFFISYFFDNKIRVTKCDLSGHFQHFADSSYTKRVYDLPDSLAYVDAFICSNQDLDSAAQDRLTVFAISNVHRLYYLFSNSYGEGFSPIFVRGDADRGLSASYNEGYSDRYLWVSFIDTSNFLRIITLGSLAWDEAVSYSVYSASPNNTCISAYHDTVACVFETRVNNVLSCRYLITDGVTPSWLYGWEDSYTTTTEAPSVTVRGGGGIGIIYRYYTSNRDGRFFWSRDWHEWTTPEKYTDRGVYYYEHAIQYLGAGQFGIAYLTTSTPTVRGAYFATGYTGDCCAGLRGNVDNSPDEEVSLGDLTMMIDHLFISLEPPACWEEANLDGSLPEGPGSVSLGDLTVLVDVLFISLNNPSPCP